MSSQAFFTKELSLWYRYIPLASEGELVINTLNLNRKASCLYIVEEVIFLLLKKWYLTGWGNPVSMQNNVVILSIHFIFLNKYMI